MFPLVSGFGHEDDGSRMVEETCERSQRWVRKTGLR